MHARSLALASLATTFIACNAILGIQELPDGDGGSPVDASSDTKTDGTLQDVVTSDVVTGDGGCTSDPDAAPPLGMTTLAPSEDSNGDGVEAFGMVASRDACVTTAALYIPNQSPPVLIGVYSNNNGKPGMLLAQAHIDSPLLGWNLAPLDKVVNVSTGVTVWFGVTSSWIDGGSVPYLDTPNGLPTYGAVLTVDGGVQVLPSTFVSTGIYSDGPITGYLR